MVMYATPETTPSHCDGSMKNSRTLAKFRRILTIQIGTLRASDSPDVRSLQEARRPRAKSRFRRAVRSKAWLFVNQGVAIAC
jgi:hypothetical protein